MVHLKKKKKPIPAWHANGSCIVLVFLVFATLRTHKEEDNKAHD